MSINNLKISTILTITIVSMLTSGHFSDLRVFTEEPLNRLSSSSIFQSSITSTLSSVSSLSNIVSSSKNTSSVYSQSVNSSSSIISQNSSSPILTDDDIPESINMDLSIERKIKDCVSKDAKIDDVVISILQDTINDPDGSSQIGIALAKRNSKSKKKNQAETYSFKVNKGRVKCKSVASEIKLIKEPTQQEIKDTQKKYKDFAEKVKIRDEKEIKESSKIPEDYVQRVVITDNDEEPVSLFNILDTPKVDAGLNSGNNPSNIYQHEDLLINTSKELGVANKNQVAYIAATGYHETGQFVDFKEDCRCADPYTYFENKYGRYSNVGGDLGNTLAGDGAKYLGRGYVHITGRANYQKYKNLTNIDIVNSPEIAASNKDLAAYITIDGMINGRFTGAKLDWYINSSQNDYFNARRTVNGIDIAAEIDGYTRNYYLTDSRIINYSLTSTPPAPANPKILFRRKNTNQCIDISGPVNGSITYTWDCMSWNQNQQWEVIPSGNDGYNYRRVGTNQCLESYNPQTEGTVYTWTCDGSQEQRFNFNWSSQNLFRFGTANNNQCVAKGSPSIGVRIKMYTCSAAPNNVNFQWDIIGV